MKDDEYFEKYCVVPVENKTVRENGYYEFIVLSERNDVTVKNVPYYLITDGKNVNLFEKDLLTPRHPASANIVDGELIITRVLHTGSDDVGYVCKYTLKNDKFEKTDDILVGSQAFVTGKMENGQLKLYYLKYNENCDTGRKDLWVIDKEYVVE